MASTLCPSCNERVEHPPHWTITVERDGEPGCIRTRLLANHKLVIHICTEPEEEHPPGPVGSIPNS